MRTQSTRRFLRPLALLAALAPVALVSGCGGGSNGPLAARPNPTAVPAAGFRALGDLRFSDPQNFPAGFPANFDPVMPTGPNAFNVFELENQPSFGAFIPSNSLPVPATLAYVQGLRRDPTNPGQNITIRVQLSPTVFLPAKRGDRPLAVGDTFNIVDNEREPAYFADVFLNGLQSISGTIRIRSISASSISFELNDVLLAADQTGGQVTVKINGVLTGVNLDRPQPL